MIQMGSAVAPELDAEVYDETVELTPDAGPWPRYWARMFDLMLGIAVLSFVGGVLWPTLFASEQTNFTALSIALIPIAMCVEAGVMTLFGTTLGKAIAGIRVETIDHQRPTFGTLFVRNMRVWFFGLALGIPLVALGTLSHNHRKVSGGVRTSWDEEGGTSVFDMRGSLARTVTVAVLYIALFGGLVALGTIKPSEHDQLLAALPEMNRGLPKAIDSTTSLTHVGLDASTIIYDYTLTNSDGSTMPAEAAQALAARFPALEASNRSKTCAERATNLIGKGVAMRYRYAAQGGVVIDYTVAPADCG